MVVSIAVSAQETTNDSVLGTNDIAGFKLYPNPVANGIVYISSQNPSTRDITVYDVFGEIVLTDRIYAKALNISRLVPGVYLVKVIENNKSITRKLVVK